MKKRITEVLGIDVIPNYWDKRYVKNLDKLSRPKYEVELHEDVWLTLRDGTRMCTDVYLPKGAGKVPALVSWSAYSKEMQGLKRGAIPPESLVFDHSLEAGDIDYFVSRGYAYIIPDPRGIGKSEGEWYGTYNPQEHLDTYDLIEWCAQQDWCDENVGMVGYSGSVKNFVALVKNGSFLVRITDMTILIEKEFIYGSSKRPNPTDYYRKQHYQCG